MRPWVLMRQAGIPFQEVMVRFDSFEPESTFKQELAGISPTGKVPVLEDLGGDKPLRIWDTLAIAEYLADQHPRLGLWPSDHRARGLARSVCADMHSGFTALRQHCPMNIEAHLPDVGALVWRDQAGVRADVGRLVVLWETLLEAYGGPMLFGGFGIPDAYFAPVCMRLQTYQLPVPPAVKRYVEHVAALPGVQAWVQDALAEHDFLDFEEPYRLGPGSA